MAGAWRCVYIVDLNWPAVMRTMLSKVQSPSMAKLYKIDELINKLHSLNNTYYSKTKLNIKPFTKIIKNYYNNLYKEHEKNELFFH